MLSIWIQNRSGHVYLQADGSSGDEPDTNIPRHTVTLVQTHDECSYQLKHSSREHGAHTFRMAGNAAQPVDATSDMCGART